MINYWSVSLSLVLTFHYESYCPTSDPLVSTMIRISCSDTCPQEMLVIVVAFACYVPTKFKQFSINHHNSSVGCPRNSWGTRLTINIHKPPESPHETCLTITPKSSHLTKIHWKPPRSVRSRPPQWCTSSCRRMRRAWPRCFSTRTASVRWRHGEWWRWGVKICWKRLVLYINAFQQISMHSNRYRLIFNENDGDDINEDQCIP